MAGVLAKNKPDILDWVAQYKDNNEVLLCHKVINNDYFFVIESGSKIKTGYLIDVTGNNEKPLSYTFSWKFQDKNGKYIESQIQPRDVKRGYLTYRSKIYSENISYRTLRFDKYPEVYVNVELNKYDSQLYRSKNNQEANENDKLNNLFICEVNN